MASSNLSPYTPIPDGALATPDLFNSRLSQLHLNTVSVDSRTSGLPDYLSVGTDGNFSKAGIIDVNTEGSENTFRVLIYEGTEGVNALGIFGRSNNSVRERFTIENNTGSDQCDINFRSATINFGDKAAAVSDVVQIIFAAPPGETSHNPIHVRRAGQSSHNIWGLAASGQINSWTKGQSSFAWKVSDLSEANPTFQVYGSGQTIEFGPGGATSPDLALGRTALGSLAISGNTLRLLGTFKPASGTASGATGDVSWTTQHWYVCVSANSWRRTALSTF